MCGSDDSYLQWLQELQESAQLPKALLPQLPLHRDSEQLGEPKIGPKPQQDFGSVEGENISSGKRMASKFAQGSAAVENVVQLSGIHLPREWTTILTVRNSFTMVNSPMVTLTATGAPSVISPQEQEQSQSQPQELQGLQEG